MENAGGGSWCGGLGRSLSSVACSKLGGSSSGVGAPLGPRGVRWTSECFAVVGGLSIIILVNGREEDVLVSRIPEVVCRGCVKYPALRQI